MKKNLYLLLCAFFVMGHSFRLSAQSYYITTLAGTGVAGHLGDGGPATGAQLNNPHSVFTDAAGNIYIADNGGYYIRKLSPAGILTTIAGTGTPGYTGDGGLATSAEMNAPFSVIVDSVGNVFFSDYYNNVVRKVNTSGIITTVVGTGTPGFLGDDSPASAAELNGPCGLSFDGAGNLIIGDGINQRIRKVNMAGIITTIAGNGSTGYISDGVPATSTTLWNPNYVHAMPNGDVYITDNKNHRIRLVKASTGIITTVAGNGTPGGAGDGTPATSAELNYPGGVNFDVAGNMYIAGDVTENVRVVNSSGIISTYAGNGTLGFIDNVIPTAGELYTPVDEAFDASGNMIIADQQNNRVRIIRRNAVPVFTNGSRQTLIVCENSFDTLNAYLPIQDSDAGQTETWSLLSVPLHGTINAGFGTVAVGGTIYTTTSTGGTVTLPIPTIEVFYQPTTGFTGVDSFNVAVSDGIVSDTTRIVVTVNAAPPPITGSLNVCAGGLTTLSDAVTGGTWSSGNTSIATVGSTGTVGGITVGGVTDIIYTTSCGSVAATVTVNISPGPMLGTLSVCTGGTTVLSDAVTGGTWFSITPSLATVSPSGTVYGVAPGFAGIQYNVGTGPAGCGIGESVSVTHGPGVLSPQSPGMCVGSTVTLTDTASGGAWGSSNTAIASISSPGSTNAVIEGASVGTAVISYSFGSCIAYDTVTVTSGAGVISRAASLPIAECEGSTIYLTDATSGGTWSSTTTTVATISSGTGGVTGVSGGTSVITYTAAGGCFATAVLTVAASSPITPATSSVCVGGSETLTETGVTGVISGSIYGSWGSTAMAAVSSGTVTGISPGTDTVTYVIAAAYTGGATVLCSYTATVNVTSGAGTITPSTAVSLCSGATTTLADATSGGVWSSGNTLVATVSSSGVIGGVSAGTATITYSVGSCNTTKVITVISGPAAISPSSPTLCTGTTVTLTDAVSGGTWSSSATGTATVTSGGVVSGVAAGTATIAYSLGSCSATAIVTVANTPAAITPSTPVIFCSASTTTLVESVTGGAWSSSATGVATVAAGVVTGVAGGTAIISYTSGSCYATKVVTVSPGPAALLPGSPTICTGNTLTLTDAVSGGTWSSSATGTATVSATGTVGAVAAGTVNILYTIGSCVATDAVTVVTAPSVGAISGTTSLCVGSSTGLTEAASGGVWSSSNAAAATVSGTGIVYGAGVGTSTISYTITSTCGVIAATHVMTVNTSPSAGSITGASSICSGTVTSLSNTVTGGAWSSSNGSAGVNSITGQVTGISPGTDTITYTITTPCGTASTSKIITIGTYLSAGTISGGALLCGGTTVALTDLTTGGTWSSSNTSATVGSTGIVTGSLAGGMDTIIYTITASCGIATSTHLVDVSPAAVSGSISGVPVLCIGSSATFTETATGGAWSSHNSNATITGGGLVVAVAAGTDIISYTVTNGCGTSVATVNVTIGGSVTAGTISGPGSVCEGTPVTLTDAISGGVWSGSNTNAAVSSGGIVTSTGLGLDTISYTVTTACGTATATFVISANGSVPTTGTIAGTSGICVGYPILFTDAIPMGVWTASNGHATITSGGLVSGVSTGTDTIIYTVTTSCGTATATEVITIGTSAGAGSIAGTSTVCAGSSIVLTDAVAGGAWSSSNTNATVAGGTVTGVTAGTAIISYSVTYSCGLTYATEDITVSPSSGISAISGPGTVCIGSTVTLTDATPGGVWSSGNTNVSVSGGIVTGMALGTSPVSYTVGSSCGTFSAVSVITIVAGSATTVAPISGISIVCIGSGITLTDATPGGIWVASNGHASVVGAGIIDGLSPGIDTIGYLVSGVCGTAEASKILNVDTIPIVAPIAGPSSQCIGTTITLFDPTPGGVWTTSTPTVGTVGVSTGVVIGLSAGSTTITYTVTNLFGCPGSSTLADAVTPSAALTGITGTAGVCVASSVTLSNATTGGTWSSSNTAVAVIDPVTGSVTGVTSGTATISYTVVNSCGAATVTSEELVNPLPTVSPISGAATGCVGSAVTLADATPGGVWSSGNTAIATVNPLTGSVTGVTSGLVTINYTVTNIFGCSLAVGTSVFINSAPAVDAITGTASECVGSSAALADGSPGGVWSSSNTSIATVNAFGAVSGIVPGTVTISYIIAGVGGGCPGIATVTDVANTIPAESPITGVLHVCAGATTTLGNSIGGGIWSSAHTSVAMVDATSGVVTGVSGGTDVIYYSVSNSCGSALDSASITVYSSPAVGAITAAYTSVCTGNVLDVSDAVTGGIWGSTNTAIASVNSTGIVLGTAAGTDTIYYVVTNTHGCESSAMISITVGGTITSATVTPVGSVELCKGHTETMHVVSAGGVTYQWLRNSSVITGATASSYTTSATGNYAVAVSNGICSETITGPSVITPPVPVVSFTAPDVLYTGTFASYQWYKNGVLISGATGSILDETGGGAYMVVVTDAGGCSDTSVAYTVGGPSTGVSTQNVIQAIKVYPNPATSVVHIDAPMQVNVSVLSIDGKVLIEQKNVTDIDISGLADGMYMILVYDQSGLLLKTAKFAKVE